MGGTAARAEIRHARGMLPLSSIFHFGGVVAGR
jgi:hypothetical protein